MRVAGAILAAMLIGLGVQADPGASAEGPANDTEVIRPPAPNYPFLASFFGVPGRCEVHFDLHDGGRHTHVRAVYCSHQVFCAEAEMAVRNAIVRVVDVPGTLTPGSRYNIVYPIEFRMYGDDGAALPEPPFDLCDHGPVM